MRLFVIWTLATVLVKVRKHGKAKEVKKRVRLGEQGETVTAPNAATAEIIARGKWPERTGPLYAQPAEEAAVGRKRAGAPRIPAEPEWRRR